MELCLALDAMSLSRAQWGTPIHHKFRRLVRGVSLCQVLL
jgi:hypothetical protein